jgi:DNA primase
VSEFVDFKAIKASVDIVRVAEWLGLHLKHNRCQCPVNEGDDRELVVTPDKQVFYCFGCKEGGYLIALTAHVKQLGLRDAALELHSHFRAGAPPKAPGRPQEAARAPSEGFQGLDYLEADNDAVQALGIPVEVAQALGIGYAKKGIMRGRICIPLRDASGKLVAYCGYSPSADPKLKLPTKFHL